MRLLVGLGNPGARYERTRHNVGYLVVDELAREACAGGWSMRCQSLVCPARLAGQQVLLAKPLTFMNISGRAVRLLLGEYGIDHTEAILILDDLNLPFGRIRVRERGSAGGHHGMESILGALQCDEVIRVRVGIGEEYLPEDKAEFVLSEFPAGREAELNEVIIRAADAVRMILSAGAARAMSVFNA